MSEGDDRKAAIGITLVSSLMLGSSYVAIKMGVGDFNPFLLSASAVSIGILICIAFMAWHGTLKRSMLHHPIFWAGSLINTWLVGCQYTGLTLTTASAGGLIIGTNVLFAAILSHIIYKEGLSRKRVVGLAIGFLGLITITTRWNPAVLEMSQVVGDLFMLGTAVGIAVLSVSTPYALKRLTYDQWTLSLHLLLPITLVALGLIVPSQSGFGWGALPIVLYIGLVCTAIPTLMWTKAMPKIGVITSSTVLMLESTFAVVLSVLLLNEPLDTFIVAGALMTFLAIYLVADP